MFFDCFLYIFGSFLYYQRSKKSINWYLWSSSYSRPADLAQDDPVAEAPTGAPGSGWHFSFWESPGSPKCEKPTQAMDTPWESMRLICREVSWDWRQCVHDSVFQWMVTCTRMHPWFVAGASWIGCDFGCYWLLAIVITPVGYLFVIAIMGISCC